MRRGGGGQHALPLSRDCARKCFSATAWRWRAIASEQASASLRSRASMIIRCSLMASSIRLFRRTSSARLWEKSSFDG